MGKGTGSGGEMLGQHVREPDEALLWKIHGEYYDLRPFCDVHPGGSLAVQLCQGTDATDLFEQFHLMNDRHRDVLGSYRVLSPDAAGFVAPEIAPGLDGPKTKP